MLKWLSGSHRKSRDIVTDDPLATIAASKSYQVYAVTRVNPIFVEEDERTETKCVCSRTKGKSGSSGYESQRSASEWSVCEDERINCRPREDTVTILEQNIGHVKSILVAVRGPTLSTIPEGKIDYCIPRPVWPRHVDRQKRSPAVYTDDSMLLYSGLRVNTTTRVHRKTQKRPILSRQMESTGTVLKGEQKSPCDILRELSHTISLAVDRKDRSETSAEEVLRNIRQKIDKSLEMLSSEAALRKLSDSLRKTKTAATIGRAACNSESSSDGCDLEAGRLSLLKRLGRLTANESLYYNGQGSSSSSAASSSGFSDLTPTPPSSSSSRPSGPVFVHDNPTSVPNSVRNAMIYGTLQCRGTKGSGYEKLGGAGHQTVPNDKHWNPYDQPSVLEEDDTHNCDTHFLNSGTCFGRSMYTHPQPCVHRTWLRMGVHRTPGTCTRIKKVIPGCKRPDFTLDVQQAEILMKKLKSGKRQRCWCRIITTSVGLLFFLFSVMLVSMLLTRGKRMFGSL